MGFKFSRNAYGLDYQYYNVRYSYDATSENYILYAKSKSNNFFRVTGIGAVETAANTYGWGVCGQIGMTNTNPSQNGKGDGNASDNV